MTEMQLNMKKFDLNEIPDGSICIFIGKRKSGKSFCIRDLLFQKKDIPYCQVVSGSEHVNPYFSDFMPSSFINEEHNDATLKMLFKRQTALTNKMDKYPEKYANADPRLLILYDDCLHDESWQKSREMRQIFNNGRHYKMFFILAMQYCMGIKPAMRENCEYVFLFRNPSLQGRRKLYECYAGAIPTFDMFCQIMDSLDKFECLVICNSADRITLEDQVFWYKAKDNGDFKFGGPQMWAHDAKMKAKKTSKLRDISEYKPNKRNRVELKINKYQ